jgi:hypothetical protein
VSSDADVDSDDSVGDDEAVDFFGGSSRSLSRRHTGSAAVSPRVETTLPAVSQQTRSHRSHGSSRHHRRQHHQHRRARDALAAEYDESDGEERLVKKK